jgi:hypothetical protein
VAHRVRGDRSPGTRCAPCAVAFVEKPVSKEGLERPFGSIRTFIDREVKRLLVVEDDEREREASSS